MKTASTQLATFLNSAQEMTVVDLYTISILKQSYAVETGVLTPYYVDNYYNTWEQDITIAGKTYKANNLIIERSRVRTVLGVEVDSLNLKVYATSDMVINGISFLQACAGGVLDGAIIKLERAFLNTAGVVQGTVVMFSGRVAQVTAGRTMSEITVNSDLELLNIKMPRNLYQTGCQHTLYDSGCQANRASNAQFGHVSTSTLSSVTATDVAAASGYFDLGALLFRSGALTGQMRTIKSYSGSTFTFVNPLPITPNAGDQFVVYAGCDKSITTCTNKFANQINFRGFPYVPVPETAR